MSRRMAREGRLRKPHRRDWPGFLRRVIPDAVWQQVNHRVPTVEDPRVRWSVRFILLCWMVMGWSVQDRLTERFREGCELLERWFYRRRRCGETYQGLIQATRRVGLGSFAEFWGCLRPTLPQQTMNRRKVLARTPEAGAVELAANLLAMALLLLYAAMVQGARVDHYSLARVLRAIRRAIEAFRHGEKCRELMAQLAAAVRDAYERRSSKRARDWPHKKKERPPSPPQLRRLSVIEKARIERVFMNHKAQVA